MRDESILNSHGKEVKKKKKKKKQTHPIKKYKSKR